MVNIKTESCPDDEEQENAKLLGISPLILSQLLKNRTPTQPTTVETPPASINSTKLRTRKRPSSTPTQTKKRKKHLTVQNIENTLANIDLEKYFTTLNINDKIEIQSFNELTALRQSTVCCYESPKNSFVMLSLLGTARIFVYNHSVYKFEESKRLPVRLIQISNNIITSLHYNNSKFYIAYMDTSKCQLKNYPTYYMDLRDEDYLLKTKIYYNSPISNIYSDECFTYVRLKSNVFHIHRKDYDMLNYKLDTRLITSDHVVGLWTNLPVITKPTRLPIVLATSRQIIVLKLDAFKASPKQSFSFNDNLEINSMIKINQWYVILRTIPESKRDQENASRCKSSIDLGFLQVDSSCDTMTFFHSHSIQFQHHIDEIKTNGLNLYILGSKKMYTGKLQYELGCMNLAKMRLTWAVPFVGFTKDSQFLVFKNRIVTVKSFQDFKILETNNKPEVECSECKLPLLTKQDHTRHLDRFHHSCFNKLKLTRNENLVKFITF